MPRSRLPDRRPSAATDFRHEGLSYTLTAGYGPSGIAEAFISSPKAGSTVAAVARDGAIAISIALQHGAPLDTLRAAMTRAEDGGPASVLGAALDALDGLGGDPAA